MVKISILNWLVGVKNLFVFTDKGRDMLNLAIYTYGHISQILIRLDNLAEIKHLGSITLPEEGKFS